MLDESNVNSFKLKNFLPLKVISGFKKKFDS
jgi:hypothetical protein